MLDPLLAELLLLLLAGLAFSLLLDYFFGPFEPRIPQDVQARASRVMPHPHPPSPPTAPVLPSRRMFDLLPPELILDIVDFAAPVDFGQTGYRQRARLLKVLCLVGRRMFAVVNPELFRAVRADGFRRVNKLVRTVRGSVLRHGVETLMLTGVCGFSDDLAQLIAALARLKRLVFVGHELHFANIDVVQLAHYRHLHQLTLVYVVLNLKSPCSLPDLQILSLCDVTTNRSSLAHVLTSSTLPRLSCLAISRLDHLNGHWATPFFPRLPANFLEQLTGLQFDYNAVQRLPDEVATHRVPKLVFLAEEQLRTLVGAVPLDPGGRLRSYSILCDNLDSRAPDNLRQWTNLQAVFLPFFFHPARSPVLSEAQISDIIPVMCQLRGIDIKWRKDPLSRQDGGTFCFDFLPLAEKLKAKQAIGADAAA